MFTGEIKSCKLSHPSLFDKRWHYGSPSCHVLVIIFSQNINELFLIIIFSRVSPFIFLPLFWGMPQMHAHSHPVFSWPRLLSFEWHQMDLVQGTCSSIKGLVVSNFYSDDWVKISTRYYFLKSGWIINILKMCNYRHHHAHGGPTWPHVHICLVNISNLLLEESKILLSKLKHRVLM